MTFKMGLEHAQAVWTALEQAAGLVWSSTYVYLEKPTLRLASLTLDVITRK